MVKYARFRERYDVAKSGQFLQSVYIRKVFICCRIYLKYRLRGQLKR